MHLPPRSSSRVVNCALTKLDRYEQEVQASNAIVVHELRTPFNAATGRLQGMIDGVFPVDARQLQMVMHRLGMLNRLVGELHLLSLAQAGHLTLDGNRFFLDELLVERLSWVTQQVGCETIRVNRNIDPTLEVIADRNRPGQVFSILVEALSVTRLAKPCLTSVLPPAATG